MVVQIPLTPQSWFAKLWSVCSFCILLVGWIGSKYLRKKNKEWVWIFHKYLRKSNHTISCNFPQISDKGMNQHDYLKKKITQEMRVLMPNSKC